MDNNVTILSDLSRGSSLTLIGVAARQPDHKHLDPTTLKHRHRFQTWARRIASIESLADAKCFSCNTAGQTCRSCDLSRAATGFTHQRSKHRLSSSPTFQRPMSSQSGPEIFDVSVRTRAIFGFKRDNYHGIFMIPAGRGSAIRRASRHVHEPLPTDDWNIFRKLLVVNIILCASSAESASNALAPRGVCKPLSHRFVTTPQRHACTLQPHSAAF